MNTTTSRRLGAPTIARSALAALIAAYGAPVHATIDAHASPLAMFLSATPVVQAVMVMLVLASLVSWAMLWSKLSEFKSVTAEVRAAGTQIGKVNRLSELDVNELPVFATLVASVRQEIAATLRHHPASCVEGLETRAAAQLAATEGLVAADLARGLGRIAIVASITPFVGLFGTVWGIMNSFVGIAASKTTSLAVVAPGIAEALLATGLGLAVAIPATVMHQVLSRRLAQLRHLMSAVNTELLCLVGRELNTPGLRASTDATSATTGPVRVV